jgi:hypothetical protein
MNPKIDFQIHEALPGLRVTGRNCGADTPVGTVFTALCRRDFPVTAPGEAVVDPGLAFVSDISLRLDAVEFYRRSIDLIPSGHTAMLTLLGVGFDTVTAALASAQDRTYFSLCISDELVSKIRNA